MSEGLLMRGWQLILGGAGAVLGALVLGSGDAPEPDPAPDPEPEENAAGRSLIPSLCAEAGLPEDVATLLNFIARGESGWNPRVGRGLPGITPADVKIIFSKSEAASARAAYRGVKKRHPDTFAGCDHPESHYTWGSGGLFAGMPAYWVHHLRSTPLRCASPFEIFDPPYAIAGAYSFARGIQRSKGYEGTVKSLRAGWWGLKKMANPPSYAHKLAKWGRHAESVGKPASYIDGPAPKLPQLDLYDLYHRLGGRL